MALLIFVAVYFGVLAVVMYLCYTAIENINYKLKKQQSLQLLASLSNEKT
jgi:hypothetical protein